MESTEGYVRTNEGFRLYFVRLGAGEPILVIPNGIYLRRDFERLARRRTVVFYDVRNRGRSDALSGAAIERGIHHDVDDLDAVRRSFHADQVDVLAHSYIATMPILYALEHPAHVNRIVQIGPMPPSCGKAYPAELKCEDETFRNILARLAQLEGERSTTDPAEFCRKFWGLLRPLYVADPSNADKIGWDRCDEPNERGLMKYWTRSLLPSIQGLNLAEDRLKTVDHPVLIVHGRKDRSSAYGGGRDWARVARQREAPDSRRAPLTRRGLKRRTSSSTQSKRF